MINQLYIGLSIIISTCILFGTGYKIALWRNGFVKKMDFNKVKVQITFMQFLLMEITSPEQQEMARNKLKSFKGEPDV